MCPMVLNGYRYATIIRIGSHSKLNLIRYVLRPVKYVTCHGSVRSISAGTRPFLNYRLFGRNVELITSKLCTLTCSTDTQCAPILHYWPCNGPRLDLIESDTDRLGSVICRKTVSYWWTEYCICENLLLFSSNLYIIKCYCPRL